MKTSKKKSPESASKAAVVTYGEVLNIRDGIAAIRAGKGSIMVAVQSGYLAKTLEPITGPVADEMQKLIDRFAEKDSKGKVINSKPGRVNIPNPKKFMKAQEEFIALEIELPKVKPLDYEQLEDMDLRISEHMLSAMKKGKIIVNIPDFGEDEKKPELKLEPNEEE